MSSTSTTYANGTGVNFPKKTIQNYLEIYSTAGQLREVVSGWYYTLRSVAMIGLLSVLVYIGIRIVISSTANEKAKYKSMILDWIVAMALLFFMHYIMAFSVKIAETITEAIDSINKNEHYIYVQDKDHKIRDAMKDSDNAIAAFKSQYFDSAGNQVDPATDSSTEQGFILWRTNEIGLARVQIQTEIANSTLITRVTATITFLVLVAYTIIFSITYIKRVIYMAFLTLIAPLVALTYPLDKINDGKAQAFTAWFREYIFNLLIQPMHLILYTVLIGTAFAFSVTNPLYTIVALGFMVPAEKILRRFFGFEKASTPGAFAGPAGAALIMSGVNNLLKKPPKDDKDDKKEEPTQKIRSHDEVSPMDMIASNDELPEARRDNNSSLLTRNREGEHEKEKDDSNVLPSPLRGDNPEVNDEIGEESPEVNNEEIRTGYNPEVNDEIGEESPEVNNEEIRTEDNSEANDETEEDNPETISTGTPTTKTPTTKTPTTKTPTTKTPTTKTPTTKTPTTKTPTIKTPTIKTPTTKTNPTLKQRLKNGTSSALNYSKRRLRGNIVNGLMNANPGKTIRRAAGMLAGGTLAGTVGLVAGITSGDLSKTFQYTTAGALVGGKYGKAAGGAFRGATKGVDTAFRKGFIGDSYIQQQEALYREEFRNNPDNFNYLLERGYDSKSINNILDNVAPDYLNEGINDMEDIVAGYELEKGDSEHKAVSRESAIAHVKLAKRTGDIRKSAKAQKEWGDRFSTEFKDTDRLQELYNSDEFINKQNKIKNEYNKEVQKIESHISEGQRKEQIEELEKKEEEKLKKLELDKAKYKEEQYKIEQEKIKEETNSEKDAINKNYMSDAMKKQKMEEAKIKRDQELKKLKDEPSDRMADTALDMIKRLYDIKDNV